MHARTQKLLRAGLAGLGFLYAATAAAAIDADAAKQLARKNNCLRCHAVSKKKQGPTYHEVAAKYAGKADAEVTLVEHLTSGAKIKFPDGHKEIHKVIKAQNPEAIRNLAAWILAQ